MTHFADRLTEAIRKKQTPLCVGLDPRWELLPEDIRRRHGVSRANRGRAYEEFCLRVLEIVAPLVGVVKPQSAFFEACGPRGLTALQQILRKAKQLGLLTILDAKRNDIASTAEAYAEAAFRVFDADALTINPYLGRDSIEPFLKIGRSLGRGLFVLVRTSNPGASQFQDLPANGAALHIHVAQGVANWSQENLGGCGYGDVGAVVGATNPEELRHLRRMLQNVILLVPGYGAQGGAAADTAGAFDSQGLGAVINSSRAILFPANTTSSTWEEAIEAAARQAIQEIAEKTPALQLRHSASS